MGVVMGNTVHHISCRRTLGGAGGRKSAESKRERNQLAQSSQDIGGRQAKCLQAWVIRTQDPIPIGAKNAD